MWGLDPLNPLLEVARRPTFVAAALRMGTASAHAVPKL